MSLDFAILGFVSYLPLTGYELKKIFDKSVRHFWTADQSQIYRTLAQLTAEGLVEMQVVEQEDRPDRKVYSITPRGREALQDWVVGPFSGGEPRNAILLNTFFMGKCSDEQVLAKFEDAARLIRGLLAAYEAAPKTIDEFSEQIHSRREAFFWTLTLEWGIKTGRANLEWVESVIERLKNNQVPQE